MSDIVLKISSKIAISRRNHRLRRLISSPIYTYCNICPGDIKEVQRIPRKPPANSPAREELRNIRTTAEESERRWIPLILLLCKRLP